MIIVRVVRFRTLKFQPRIVTSFRPHGKWGDLLVCLIPTMWCINILINSSFLLKLIEWQNESSLFTVRIRGKQWYWVYKFDVKDVVDILSIGKNVGHNRFYYPTPNSLEVLDDYLHLIQLRASNVWLKKYWNASLKLQGRENYEYYTSIFDQTPFINSTTNINSISDELSVGLKKNVNFEENLRWLKRGFGKNEPLKLVKTIQLGINDDIILKTRYGTSDNLIHKNVTYNPYLVIKQKRYTLKKKILEKGFTVYNKEYENNSAKTIKSNFFLRNYVGGDVYDNLTKVYKFFKKTKKRNELFSVVTSRRLLRTKHTLVLPAHVNITAITNSYDVVHSWFIPGLGLKLDCIPGRATHHTFYADNAGFYYGQCAEICGRYHHHMPIRVCILPYDQFLVWWHHFGLPRLMYSGKNRIHTNNVYFRRYVW